MFEFTVKYFGFLKHIPLLPHLFDAWIKIGMFFSNRKILDYIDDIEKEVLSWEKTSARIHKFGGIQFDHDKKEIGHIHSNGLLDILFSKEIKGKFLMEGKVKGHHTFRNSGWITFQIKAQKDKAIAIELLRYSYSL